MKKKEQVGGGLRGRTKVSSAAGPRLNMSVIYVTLK